MTDLAIATVLFDADGVLQDPVEHWRPALERRFALAGDALDALVQSVIATELSYLTRDDGFLTDLDAALQGLDLAGRSTEVLEVLNAIRINDEIIDIVRELRGRGIHCHLATNQQPHRAQHMSEQIGYRNLFHREFYSCRIGIAKPDIGFFEFILSDLGVPARSVLFIDDREANVASAKDAGLQASVFPVAGGAMAMRTILGRFGL